MRKGTRFILIISATLAIGIAFGVPIADYRSCEVRLRKYSEDQQDWGAFLAKRKTLQQVTDRALIRAHDDDAFREGRWNPPVCNFGGELLGSILGGIVFFMVAVIGAHLAWLGTRAFNKLMEKLQ